MAALAAQDRALALKPAYGPALYERVTLLGRALLRRTRELQRLERAETGRRLWQRGGGAVQSGDVASSRSGRAMAASDPAARDLARRIAADAAALKVAGGVDPGEAACVKAWKALVESRTADAEAGFEQAVGRSPTLAEAFEALADLAHERREFAKAVAWLDQTISHDRGYVPALNAQDDARLYWGVNVRSQGQDPGPHLDAARADFTAALALDPARTESLLGLGITKFVQGYHTLSSGRNGAPLFEDAAADFTRVLKADSRHAEALGASSCRGATTSRRGSPRGAGRL